MLKFKIFRFNFLIFLTLNVIILFFISCSKPNYKIITANASKYWQKKNFHKSCNEISKIQNPDFSRWNKKNIYTYLTIKTYCNVSQYEKNNIYKSFENPYKNYSRGMEYLFPEKSFQKSISIFQNLIKKYPLEYEFKYKLALLYEMNDDFKKSLNILLKINQNEVPDYAKVKHLILLAKCQVESGNLNKIPQLLNKILSYEKIKYKNIVRGRKILMLSQNYKIFLPEKVKQKVKQAQIQIEKHHAGKAIELLENILHENPSISVIHYLSGVIHLHLGNRPEALIELEKAVKLNHGEFLAHYLLGRLYLVFNQSDKAEKHLKEALKWNPFMLQATKLLKNIYLKKHNYQEALNLHKTLLTLSKPSFRNSLTDELAVLQYKTGHIRKALDTYKQIIKNEGHENGFYALLEAAKLHMILSEKELRKTAYHRKQALKYINYAEKLRPTSMKLKAVKKLFSEGKYIYPQRHVKISGANRITEDANLF